MYKLGHYTQTPDIVEGGSGGSFSATVSFQFLPTGNYSESVLKHKRKFRCKGRILRCAVTCNMTAGIARALKLQHAGVSDKLQDTNTMDAMCVHLLANQQNGNLFQNTQDAMFATLHPFNKTNTTSSHCNAMKWAFVGWEN